MSPVVAAFGAILIALQLGVTHWFYLYLPWFFGFAAYAVLVGDTDQLIKTAANRFFAKPESDQVNTLTDLLSSSARRAINLLTHDQLFSARSSRSLPPGAAAAAATALAVATGLVALLVLGLGPIGEMCCRIVTAWPSGAIRPS